MDTCQACVIDKQVETDTKTLTIYIFMDDSGKLTRKEEVSVYGGIAFYSQKDKDKFNRQYKSIVKSIKCEYCEKNIHNCTQKECPEIKSFIISKKHKRRIINLCKKYHTYAVLNRNAEVHSDILETKASKGRYTDYVQKRIIKKIILDCIRDKVVDPNENLNLIIQIDQQSTKSNGYYNLHDSITEELSRGIINYNYGTRHKPVIHGNLNVSVTYLDSKKVYSIQASDIIAGYARAIYLHNSDARTRNQKLDSFLKTRLIMP